MITWQESLAVLKNGNKRFIQNKMHDILQHDLKLLSETQNPHTVILCCSDSRVSPDIIFDQSLGNLFVIQNAGNVSDTSVLGSIQYAIQHLKTPLIIVLGHTCCGAVTASHQNKKIKVIYEAFELIKSRLWYRTSHLNWLLLHLDLENSS